VSKTWQKLAPLVLFERQRRNDPEYYLHFEQLAKHCTQLDKRGLRRTAADLAEQRDTLWLEKAL